MTAEETMTYADRIAAGAEFLDARPEEFPGWRSRIDLDTLDMTSGEDCVIGQLTGDYDAWESSNPDVAVARLGFLAYSHHGPSWTRAQAEYVALRQAWREYLLDGYVSSPDPVG